MPLLPLSLLPGLPPPPSLPLVSSLLSSPPRCTAGRCKSRIVTDRRPTFRRCSYHSFFPLFYLSHKQKEIEDSFPRACKKRNCIPSRVHYEYFLSSFRSYSCITLIMSLTVTLVYFSSYFSRSYQVAFERPDFQMMSISLSMSFPLLLLLFM